MMRRMRPRALARIIMAAGLALAGQQAAAYSCNLSADALTVNYAQAANTQAVGYVTLNCTRTSGEPASMGYWISMNDGETGTRRLYRHGGTDNNANRLAFTIGRNGYTNTWRANGANRAIGTLEFGTGTSASVSLPYYLQIASGQNGRTVGIYDGIVQASLSLSNGGAVVATANVVLTASIIDECFIGQVASGFAAPGAINPSTLSLNYTAFTATPVVANMNFTVHCTRGTAYDVALSPASGTLLGLNYSLSVSGESSTGDGLARTHVVTGTIAANQAGSCPTSAASCFASQPTTITVTY